MGPHTRAMRKEDHKMMMTRRGCVVAMIVALGVVGFSCGKTGSDGQMPEARSNETKAVGTGIDESTNGFASAPFSLGVRDWSGQVGEFVKSEGKDLETIQLRDGTVFVGEVAGGVPDGHGVLTQTNGTKQEGEWRHGRAYRLSGTWVGPDGTKEIGTWNDDGTTSGGTILWKDGRVYKGDWRLMGAGTPDVPDGTGAMTWPDGRTYTGHFLDGEMDGAGKMTYPDGKIEDGTWMQGKFMGAGVDHGTPTSKSGSTSDEGIGVKPDLGVSISKP